MQPLHLTLKKKWFDLIASGIKKEEYREMKDYWCRRFCGKEWYKYEDLSGNISLFPDTIIFRLGYASGAPIMRIECLGIKVGYGKSEWGATDECFVLKLGKIYQIDNYSILGKKDLVNPECLLP